MSDKNVDCVNVSQRINVKLLTIIVNHLVDLLTKFHDFTWENDDVNLVQSWRDVAGDRFSLRSRSREYLLVKCHIDFLRYRKIWQRDFYGTGKIEKRNFTVPEKLRLTFYGTGKSQNQNFQEKHTRLSPRALISAYLIQLIAYV